MLTAFSPTRGRTQNSPGGTAGRACTETVCPGTCCSCHRFTDGHWWPSLRHRRAGSEHPGDPISCCSCLSMSKTSAPGPRPCVAQPARLSPLPCLSTSSESQAPSPEARQACVLCAVPGGVSHGSPTPHPRILCRVPSTGEPAGAGEGGQRASELRGWPSPPPKPHAGRLQTQGPGVGPGARCRWWAPCHPSAEALGHWKPPEPRCRGRCPQATLAFWRGAQDSPAAEGATERQPQAKASGLGRSRDHSQ